MRRARGRRYSKAEAMAILESYTELALATAATTLPKAIALAEANLNRAASRALGARSDGSFHPMARPMAVVRSRNRW